MLVHSHKLFHLASRGLPAQPVWLPAGYPRSPFGIMDWLLFDGDKDLVVKCSPNAGHCKTNPSWWAWSTSQFLEHTLEIHICPGYWSSTRFATQDIQHLACVITHEAMHTMGVLNETKIARLLAPSFCGLVDGNPTTLFPLDTDGQIIAPAGANRFSPIIESDGPGLDHCSSSVVDASKFARERFRRRANLR